VRRRMTREESAEQTRRRLLEAAEAVFLERGFHAATLDGVAERAGFTTGAVYSRFESKADLFLALLDERNPRTVRAFADMAAGARSAAELVGSFGRWWTERLREGPAWSLVLVEFWTSVGRDPDLRGRFADSHARLMSSVAEVIDAAAEDLGVRLAISPIDLARVTSALGRGLELERLLNPDAVDDALTAWAFGAFADEPGELATPMSMSSTRKVM
jgi:AcrR family transcriptional regulator